MKELYFYPGRFQPMGPHHAETFNTVMSKYGAENSYIVTSNKVDFSLKGGVPKSPLNFQEKKAIMVAHGIPGNNIVQVSNPYYVKEVLFNYKPEEVEAVYLVGAKDMAENPRFKKTEGVTKEGYKWRIEVVPHIDKCIGGEEMCGTSTRVALKDGDEKTFKDIMGWFDQDIFNTLKKKLNNKDIDEDLYNPEDKVNDYMRSSEYKAGYSKDYDIEPGYKYRRGGMYTGGGMGAGGMYESRGGESEMHIYDFDETIARVETPIPYTVESPEGKIIEKGETTSINFEKTKDFLKDTYDEGIIINWDFKAFANLISKGTLNNEVFQKLLDSIKNPNAKVTILTARAVGLPVTKFLKDQGIWAYVVPLGLNKEKGQSVTGEDKANWIEKRLKDTTKKVIFIDDAPENRKAIYALRDKYTNIEFSVEDPATVSETMKEDTASDIKTIEGAFKNVFKALNVDSADVGINEFTELINLLKGTGENWEKQLQVIAQWFKDIAEDSGITLDEMMGMMNKQEKAKHSKNMKRLSKDMSNMKGDNHGGGGHKVPDYVKGTLTRKLYEVEKTNTFSKNWWKEQLTEVITETKANTHLTHLEELVLTQGQDGYNQARSFLFELIKNLKGESNNIKNVSVKWDGAPAVWAGINPENGKFFVGIKGIFNKVTPKINYTPQDIDKNHGHSGDLAKKLKLALQYLPALGIKGILQGDFMFDSDDVQTEDIDGAAHYTFKPNTIRYAIEANSEIGKKILNAKIGVIWHTTYTDLSSESGASFGADVSGLSQTPSVWFDDAYFKDDTGVLLSNKEEEFVLEKIKEADSLNVDYDNLPDEISSRAKTNLLNTYLNSEVRIGEFITDPNKSFERFKNWYQQAVDKSIEKVKRPESKERKRKAGEEKLKLFDSKKEIVLNLFRVSKLLSEAKAIFITKYDKAVATKHFIDNGDGTLRVTKAEGFVAVDHTENGIKLVDRLEFSKNNFNAGKPGS